MWSDIFPKLSHIFNLLDNIGIMILLENTYEMQKEIKTGNFLRINLLGHFIYDVIDKIRPFLEDKKSLKFANMNINGCMCKICQDIAFDTTIEDIGIILENEIGSLKAYINCYINVLQYEMINNGKVNLVVRNQKIFLRRLMRVLHHILNDLDKYYPLFIYDSTL